MKTIKRLFESLLVLVFLAVPVTWAVDQSSPLYSQTAGVSKASVTVTGATYTIQPTDTHIIANYAGTVTLTFPAASISNGRLLSIKTIQAQAVSSASATNILPCASATPTSGVLAATAGKWAELFSDGNYWIIAECN